MRPDCGWRGQPQQRSAAPCEKMRVPPMSAVKDHDSWFCSGCQRPAIGAGHSRGIGQLSLARRPRGGEAAQWRPAGAGSQRAAHRGLRADAPAHGVISGRDAARQVAYRPRVARRKNFSVGKSKELSCGICPAPPPARTGFVPTPAPAERPTRGGRSRTMRAARTQVIAARKISDVEYLSAFRSPISSGPVVAPRESCLITMAVRERAVDRRRRVPRPTKPSTMPRSWSILGWHRTESVRHNLLRARISAALPRQWVEKGQVPALLPNSLPGAHRRPVRAQANNG